MLRGERVPAPRGEGVPSPRGDDAGPQGLARPERLAGTVEPEGPALAALPGSLATLLARTLHPDPSRRPGSAAELLASLEAEREARHRNRRLRWLRVLAAPAEVLPPGPVGGPLGGAAAPGPAGGPPADREAAEAELRAYLAALARLAGIDGLSPEEAAFISTAALALGLPESLAREACREALDPAVSGASLAGRLRDRRLRLCLLRDAVRLAAVDGTISPAEARELEEIEGALRLGPAGVRLRELALREAALERDLEALLDGAADRS
jgi:hypothetical protein